MGGGLLQGLVAPLEELRDADAVAGTMTKVPQLQCVPTDPSGADAGRGPARARDAVRDVVPAAALLAGDVAVFVVAGIALAPWGAMAGQMPEALMLVSGAAIGLCWIGCLYPGYGIYPHELLRRRATAFSIAGGLALAGILVLGGGWWMIALLVPFLTVAFPLQVAARSLVRALLRQLGCWGVSAEIIGDAEQVATLREFFAANWHHGIRCEPPGASRGADAKIGLVASPRSPHNELDRVRRRYSEVIVLAGIPGGRISGLRPADLRGEIGLRLKTPPSPSRPSTARRMLDLLTAFTALVLTAPLLLLAAGAIYVVDPGPVLYRQTREGLGGRQFRILKLRTMYCDADQRLETLLAADTAAREEWTRHYKLRTDPRILPLIGGFLRATSIDELPQLLNVIAGDMRIVGPRPFPLYHLAAMNAEFRAKRCTVMPGVTGLWQTAGRSTADIDRQQDLDGFYIDNRSFWFDAHILMLTAAAIIRGEGAY